MKKFLKKEILTKANLKDINGGELQTDVYCKDGTGFSIQPHYPFSPQEMCADHGGFGHFETYDVE
ncbi:hypothetical protein ACG2LH_09305 [Zhouia sp. PK063]|uniref:hypothetical protein n=1 Tax=Zhouia sp. PK063 TaxID=3373602 RepID=UPI0037A5CD1D